MLRSRGWLWLLIIAGAYSSVAGSGLYKPTDNVTIFNTDNIGFILSTSSSLWLVEYYLEWCGHCQHYVPIYNAFANDVADWFSVVKIGVMNCADQKNSKFCTMQNITAVPALKLYTPVGSSNLSLQHGQIMKSVQKASLLRENLIKLVEKNMHTVLWNYKRPKPTFDPVSYAYVSRFLRSKRKTTNYRYLAIVFEENDNSSLGKEIILDMSACGNIVVRRLLLDSADSRSLQKKIGIVEPSSVVVFFNNGSFFFAKVREKKRHAYVTELRKLREIKPEKDIDYTDAIGENFRAHSKTNLLLSDEISSNQVYLADIESGLNYMFTMEIASNKIISGGKLVALTKLLKLFSDVELFFPGRLSTRRFLSDIYLWTKPRNIIVVSDWLKKISEIKNHSYLPQTNRVWVGCRSSIPNLRGYPCSLWTIFHTLTVASYRANIDRRLFHDVMNGYVTHFFGCLECRKNFKNEIKSLPYNYTDDEHDAILWLWKMHNKVNKRLHIASSSEDPEFPKLQFPPESLCPGCREAGTSNWKEKEVAEFLIQRFSSENISWDFTDVEKENIDSDVTYDKRFPAGDDAALRLEMMRFASIGFRRVHEAPAVMTGLDLNLCLFVWFISALLVVSLLVAVHRRSGFLRNLKPSRLSL